MNYIIEDTQYILYCYLNEDKIIMNLSDFYRISLDDFIYAGFSEDEIEGMCNKHFTLEIIKPIARIEENNRNAHRKIKMQFKGIRLRKGKRIDFLISDYIHQNFKYFDVTQMKFALSFLQKLVLTIYDVEESYKIRTL